MKQIKWVKNTMPKTDDANLPVMALEEVEKPALSTKQFRDMREHLLHI